jgi:hypothetical protein
MRSWAAKNSSCSILPSAMKPSIFAICIFGLGVAFVRGPLSAQKPTWQPLPGHAQVPIWPGPAPDPQPVAGPEYVETSGKDFLPGGRPAVGVGNVTRPTMHGFGLRRTSFPITAWPQLVETWLATIGMIPG